MRVTRSTWLVRTATIPACIIAVVAAFGSALTFAHEDHAPLPTKGVTIAGNNILLSDKARVAIGLTTAEVTFADLYRTIEVNARVELPWKQQAMITSLVPGKIDQVLVRPGESVVAGQELARVVSMDLEAIQLAMLQATSEVKLAKQLVEQRKSLDATGAIAGKSLLEAEANLAQRTAELRIAEEKFRALGMSDATLQRVLAGGQPLRFVSITSPISGIITHADARIGQVVKTTDHLYHVVNPSRVWIVGEVLESDVRYLKKGQPVVAHFAAYPQKPFKGVIDHVRLKMDRRRRTQSVVIAVDNRERLLRPGMSGRVSIGIQVAKEAIVCPADAVNKTRTGKYVLVQRSPGKYENRLIKIGLAKKDRGDADHLADRFQVGKGRESNPGRLPDLDSCGVPLEHVALYPNPRQILYLKKLVFGMSDLSQNDIKTDKPTVNRRTDRYAGKQVGRCVFFSKIDLFQSVNLLFRQAVKSQFSLETSDELA